jgi:hypothetical protein
MNTDFDPCSAIVDLEAVTEVITREITIVIMVIPMTTRTILEVMIISNTKGIKIQDLEAMQVILEAAMEVMVVANPAVVAMEMVATAATAAIMAATVVVAIIIATEVIVVANKATKVNKTTTLDLEVAAVAIKTMAVAIKVEVVAIKASLAVDIEAAAVVVVAIPIRYEHSSIYANEQLNVSLTANFKIG